MTTSEKRDILEVISEFVDLEKRGTDSRPYYIARCPFHEDTNPSFLVYPNIQKFVCYVCTGPKGGDVIDFYRLKDNISFKEAQKLATSEIPIETALEKYLHTDPGKPQVDTRRMVVRANTLFKHMEFEQANHYACMVWYALQENNWLLADRILKEAGA